MIVKYGKKAPSKKEVVKRKEIERNPEKSVMIPFVNKRGHQLIQKINLILTVEE